jgi:hypothetical protein
MLQKKIFFVLFFLLILGIPTLRVHGATTDSNTGFIPSNIWYSIDDIKEGDKVKIYTVIFNGDSRELSGNILFFDDTTLLCKKSFVVNPKSTKDISIDWVASAGRHNIFGKIEKAKFLISPGKYEEVTLAQNETEKSTKTVEKKISKNITGSESSLTIQNIQNEITSKTPEVVKDSVIGTTNVLDKMRVSISASTDSARQDVKKDLEKLQNNEKDTKAPKDTNYFLKPLKYLELFLLTIASFIFGNKFTFYLLVLFIIFLIIRFIYRYILG